ncbi:hypothetical protein DNTS_029702 [Danionella cerebrum]|uniref:Chemokine interleukin-8-like domain-containing protein n=1 Tax=Danionella cerebrum TaxID=2873325 RepID=A0A553QUH6_9TELE|nr:hypothetical protein DNTS_029702 [Danionella translucida]
MGPDSSSTKRRTAFLQLLTTSMFLKPVSTRFLRSSQPIPPAPTTRTRQEERESASSLLSGPTRCTIVGSEFRRHRRAESYTVSEKSSVLIKANERMKTASSVCLLLGLILQGSGDAQAQPLANGVPSTCCFGFIDFKIPPGRILRAEKTSPLCPDKGILVSTQRTQFCVDPNEAWIKKVMGK